MAEFLDGFESEKLRLVGAVSDFEKAWTTFQERRGAFDTDDRTTDSLISSELERVRRELEATRFTVGLFGLIKRGKSTLLNSLIGREVSTMHVTPETAVPVYVSYGEQPHAIVHFADGRREEVAVEAAAEYTSQRSNAGNHLGVTHVDQFVPVGFLRHGARLLDTAGLDDADVEAGYGERTLRELDTVDAGIVVFLAPPTVGATELEFLEEMATRDLKKTFLVCNLFPQYFHDPAARNDVLRYVGTRIVESTRRTGVQGEVRIYPVCALEAWEARQNHDVRAWRRSGADRLLRDLEAFLAETAGAAAITTAADRIVRASEAATAQVRLRLDLLKDPEHLDDVKTKLDNDLAGMEHGFNMALADAMRWIEPVRQQVRTMVEEPFGPALERVGKLKRREVGEFVEDLRTAVQVAATDAAYLYADGLADVVGRLKQQLEQQFNATMSDLAPDLPMIEISTTALLDEPDVKIGDEFDEKARPKVAVPFATGLAGGGAAFAAAGALLGPIGLVGGALVGWGLGKVKKPGSSREEMRALLAQKVEQVQNAVTREVDRQLEHAILAVRAAVTRQREEFALDVRRQVDLVMDAADDPARLAAQRFEAEEFLVAFERTAERARTALKPPSPDPTFLADEDEPPVAAEERRRLLKVV